MANEKYCYFKPDNVKTNRLWGFDYSFCGGDCANVKCGRNIHSRSGIEMRKREHVYTCSDFTKTCNKYIEPKGVDDGSLRIDEIRN